MEFFLEMVLTAAVALLFSFLVAKLVSVATAGGGNGSASDSEKSGIHAGEDVVVDERQFGQKMEARVLDSERNVGIVEENVEHVDRFVGDAARVDELEEAATGSGEIGDEGEELVVESSEAESAAVVSPENVVAEDVVVRGREDREAEIGAAVSPENMKAEDMVVRGPEEREAEIGAAVSPENVTAEEVIDQGREERETESGAAVSPENVTAEEMIDQGREEREKESGAAVSPENVTAKEMIARGQEERKSEPGAAVSPENVIAKETIVRGQEERSESAEERSDQEEIEESGDVAVAESEEIRTEESGSKEGIEEKTEELNIEEEDDDDWEGIEKSELQKAFAAAAKFVEESEEALEVGSDAKTELYGLHKIATEGPCRDSQPMALMVSARAKWNAWQKLGNMSQEEAMEQYLALVSKEIPGCVHPGSIVEKKPETGTPVVLPPDSGSSEPLPHSNTTDSKNEAVEDDINEAPSLDKAKSDNGD